MTATVNPHQSAANRRFAILLQVLWPIIDNPFAELLQQFLGFAVKGRLGGHADEKGHVRQDHRRGHVVAHISRVGQRRQEIGGEEGACKLEKELSRLVDIGAERKSRARRLLRRL